VSKPPSPGRAFTANFELKTDPDVFSLQESAPLPVEAANRDAHHARLGYLSAKAWPASNQKPPNIEGNDTASKINLGGIWG